MSVRFCCVLCSYVDVSFFFHHMENSRIDVQGCVQDTAFLGLNPYGIP